MSGYTLEHGPHQAYTESELRNFYVANICADSCCFHYELIYTKFDMHFMQYPMILMLFYSVVFHISTMINSQTKRSIILEKCGNQSRFKEKNTCFLDLLENACRQMDGWMDGWMDAWMDGWVDWDKDCGSKRHTDIKEMDKWHMMCGTITKSLQH